MPVLNLRGVSIWHPAITGRSKSKWWFPALLVAWSLVPLVTFCGPETTRWSQKRRERRELHRWYAYATKTQEGNDLEELFLNASDLSQRHFFQSYQAVLAHGRDGPVPGLRSWLRAMELENYAHEVMLWAEEMGACDLEEVLENVEDLVERLGLASSELGRLEQMVEMEMEPPRPMNGSEREELLHFWSLHWHHPRLFQAFDEAVQLHNLHTSEEPSKDEGNSGAEGLSSKLFNEMRSRLQGDLQYLWVMRQQAAWNLPMIPSLEGDRTWTFCGGSERWLQLASASGTSHAFPVPLAPLVRPQRRAMETVILGAKRRGFRFLQTYVALERFHPQDLQRGSSGGGAWPVDAVNRSKLLCLAKARDLHGAGGLPDWNRSVEDVPIPLGITKQSQLENKTEVVRQLRRYLELMDNTRIGQADKYFGHALFGLLLSRLWKRFDLLRESQLLSLEDVQSQRALLESQVGQRKDLEDSLFEAFVSRSLDLPGSEPLEPESETPCLTLTSNALQALRRHVEHVFGAGLREEIFVPLSRATKEGAQLGLSAAGPGLCAEALEKAAMIGELRMLSLSDGSKERLMWHGLVFGSLLGQHSLDDVSTPYDVNIPYIAKHGLYGCDRSPEGITIPFVRRA
eukprot:symbB.v1.2.010372.t1/scaffold631.1/size348893/13